jgi:hypothetical protein
MADAITAVLARLGNGDAGLCYGFDISTMILESNVLEWKLTIQ